MNNTERQIILSTYKTNYSAHHILTIDHADTLYQLKFMLDQLNLKKERYIIENNIIAEQQQLTRTQITIYGMIFDTFAKYGRLIHYNLNDIDMYYEDNIKYKMTDEDIKCHEARIKGITD